MQAVFPAVFAFAAIDPGLSWLGQLLILILLFAAGAILFVQGVSHAKRDRDLNFFLLLSLIILAGVTALLGELKAPAHPVLAPITLVIALVYARVVRKLDGHLSPRSD